MQLNKFLTLIGGGDGVLKDDVIIFKSLFDTL